MTIATIIHQGRDRQVYGMVRHVCQYSFNTMKLQRKSYEKLLAWAAPFHPRQIITEVGEREYWPREGVAPRTFWFVKITIYAPIELVRKKFPDYKVEDEFVWDGERMQYLHTTPGLFG